MTLPSASLDDLRTLIGDRYAIDRELGHGGMGAVYLVRDLALDRPVALKVLPPAFATDPSLRERFLRETRTAASFSHPNIVPVHGVEDRPGLLAFTMGFIEGESLADRVERSGPLDTRGMVRLLLDVAYGLAYAHGRGVVHRDIKPDNIMIERATGRALLMDFGISRPIASRPDAPGLTRVGEVVGTPEFMSPEQATGDFVDGRTDIYSLGLVALYALTGRKQITGTSTQQIITRQLTQLPPPAAELRPDIPSALAAAIDRCVAKAADERFPTAEALVEAIEAAQLAAPEVPLPIRLFAQEVATLGLVLFFLVLFTWMLAGTVGRSGDLNVSLPILVLIAVGLTRVIESFQNARRLGALGFTATEVERGFRRVADERDEHRHRLLADPATVTRRRTTVRRTVAQLALAIVLVAAGVMSGKRIDGRSIHVGLLGGIAVVTGMCLFAVSLVLLARSPFRPAMGERLFRRLWLGPVGRRFLALAIGNGRRTMAGSRS